MGLQAYKFGVKPGQMPEPYHFLWATVGFAVSGILAMGNERLGVVLAWGLMIGAFVYSYQTDKQQEENATKNGNPSSQQLIAAQPFNPFQNRSTGNQAI